MLNFKMSNHYLPAARTLRIRPLCYHLLFSLRFCRAENKDSGFTDTIESESEGSHERYSRGSFGGWRG
jgi:hypothetical protein